MWHSWKERWQDPRVAAKDAGVVAIFLLGVGAALVGIFTHDLGLLAAATTLFGIVGIARS